MVKTTRFRSTSGGSPAMMGAPVSANDGAARQLLEIVLHIRNSRGHGLLHQSTSQEVLLKRNQLVERWGVRSANIVSHLDNLETNSHDQTMLKTAQLLLERLGSLDSDLLMQEFLQQTDLESGYTPLHVAIFQADLSVVLLLLRFPFERLSERPMQILSEKCDSIKDAEGLTPFRLLAQLQVKILSEIKASLPRPAIHTDSGLHGRSRRSSSFSFEEQEDEFRVLMRGMSIFPSSSDSSSGHSQKASNVACEVMSFGRANLAALGVSDTTKSAHLTNRPQRVQEFALSENRHNSAIQVAAAAHHTLVLTKLGHVYACGLGNGGRLGTSEKDQSLTRPTRILAGLSKRRVTQVAAAENHSLCVTSEGHLFAWGSNRFGQVDPGSSVTTRCLPHRVIEIKKSCVAVAAGDRHSVALTRNGEVYTFGDNSKGQLGRSTRGKIGLDRVEALWVSDRVAIQVAASEESTLVLIAPPRSATGLPFNSVYSWGHGNPVPTKVMLQTQNSKSGRVANPIDISCAKHHNAAITSDGKVYTWGLHAEPLGGGNKMSSSLMVASLVKSMLPENGGGLAVSISASDQHTAVVTAEGFLYTWGYTEQKNLMGHEGVRWQPKPKRVPGVHRAVGVAVAKEHTVLLVGTAYPQIPVVNELTLESLAARRVCDHVDMFNVVPMTIMAERSQSKLLQLYCRAFIRRNLDGILSLGRKSEMDVYLNERLLEGRIKHYAGEGIHPLISQALMNGKSKQEWLDSCPRVLNELPVSTLVRYRRPRKRRASSCYEHITLQEHEEQNLETGLQGCSERCLMLTANLGSLHDEAALRSKYECLGKEVRGIKKRLTQITKLERKESLTREERDKLNRTPLLEADLTQLISATARVEKFMSERNIDFKSAPRAPVSSVVESSTIEEGKSFEPQPIVAEEAGQVESFRCDVCDISCPDANSLRDHMLGRKHRNRAQQIQKEQREKASAIAIKEQQKRAILTGALPPAPPGSEVTSPWKKGGDSVQLRYLLAPPSVPVGPSLVDSCAKPADFRSILAEEEMKGRPIKPKSKPQRMLSPGNIAPLKNAPWATAPVVRVPMMIPNKLPSASKKAPPAPIMSKKKQSLSEFMNGAPTTPKPKASPATAPWSSPPNVATKPVVAVCHAHSSSPSKSSLLEIQQEEEAYRLRMESKRRDKDGKWFVERVDHADSFSAIQKADEQARQHRALVEEQLRIEEEIARERKHEQAKTINRQRGGRKNKSGNKNVSKGKKKTNSHKSNGTKQKNPASAPSSLPSKPQDGRALGATIDNPRVATPTRTHRLSV